MYRSRAFCGLEKREGMVTRALPCFDSALKWFVLRCVMRLLDKLLADMCALRVLLTYYGDIQSFRSCLRDAVRSLAREDYTHFRVIDVLVHYYYLTGAFSTTSAGGAGQ